MHPARQDPAWVRRLLVGLTLFAVGFLIIIPVINVFAEAFAGGIGRYVHTLVMDPDTRHAIVLTFTILPFALVLNVVFGLAAAYAITRFNFRGRTVLTALIDLPFSVSPVVAGLMFVLIFGLQGYLGPFLRRDGYALMPYLVSVGVGGVTAGVRRFRRRDSGTTGWKRNAVVIPAGAALAFTL